VLGKIIGVYLGRPFEGWSYDRIMAELGEVNYYVHEKRDVPLIVTDDDISGTFTFLRALPDYDNTPDLTPAQIGQTWLNYIIKERSILWWGGLGNSTEHTAYLRLASGIEAPRSGSIELNGKVVAEQIGSQIFIDGWAMVAPGDPERAADLAGRAASVSHDGEAVYGAQVIAAMESLAFIEPKLDILLDTAVALIPKQSVIYRMINDIRDWHAETQDWRVARQFLADNYGYDKYGGNCHMVPNHGLIIQSLLYGDDDFQKSLMIVNTSGWDTDCNSGNVGCLLGIKNGLAGLANGPDWRGPVADRMYLAAADGGRAITNAATEAYHIINIGRALAGQEPIVPKDGARFHFALPGSVQGFMPEASVETQGTVTVENVRGYSEAGERSLALRYNHLAPGRVARVATATYIPSLETALYFERRGYRLMASPTLYPGQTVQARLTADPANQRPVQVSLYLRSYETDDTLVRHYSQPVEFAPGQTHQLSWPIEQIGGPIAEIGVEINGSGGASGSLYMDYLTWDGAPNVTFTRPDHKGGMWRRAWIDAVDVYGHWWPEPFRLVHNQGTGLLSQGTREWTDYRVSADVTPHMVDKAGIGARVQGLRRYYALLLDRAKGVKLVKVLDGETLLAEQAFDWAFGKTYQLSLEVVGSRLRAWVDGQLFFEVEDEARPLVGGAVALLCHEGRTATQAVKVEPAG
jgi:hypothetical protein